VNSGAAKTALAALAMLLAGAPAALSQQAPPPEDATLLHDRCVSFSRTEPKQALERAKLWRDEGGGYFADHCIAMALFELHDYKAAAKRFEEIAARMMQLPVLQRAQTLDQAGQAWLMGNDPTQAKADFDAAIALNGGDAEMYVDRAQALALGRHYWEAIDDLNRAIDLEPKRADAYIYRATAYRLVEAIDLAIDDVENGLRLTPDSVDGLLERGILHRLKGDLPAARADWQRVVQLAPTSTAGAAAKTNLAGLGVKSEEAPVSVVRKKKPAGQ
jgi:tetratricopeptide (TPR) repeat protein